MNGSPRRGGAQGEIGDCDAVQTRDENNKFFSAFAQSGHLRPHIFL